jgi:hypothetical protein
MPLGLVSILLRGNQAQVGEPDSRNNFKGRPCLPVVTNLSALNPGPSHLEPLMVWLPNRISRALQLLRVVRFTLQLLEV